MQWRVGLCVGETVGIGIVLKQVKQGVFVLLNAVCVFVLLNEVCVFVLLNAVCVHPVRKIYHTIITV